MQAATDSLLDKVIIVARAEDALEWVPGSQTPDSGNRRKWTPVRCATADAGFAESLRCGVRKAREMNAEAVMVLLADQPFVTAELIDRLIALHHSTNKSYIAAAYASVPRPPVLFGRSMFPALMRLQGDEGARRLIQSDAGANGLVVEWHDAACFYDIDTQTDYESILEQWEAN